MRRLFAAFAVLVLVGGFASAAPFFDCGTVPPDLDPGTWVELFAGGGPVGTAGPVDEAEMVIVPVPGAILLTAIGTALVGWLRRRKAL